MSLRIALVAILKLLYFIQNLKPTGKSDSETLFTLFVKKPNEYWLFPPLQNYSVAKTCVTISENWSNVFSWNFATGFSSNRPESVHV